MMTFGTSFTPVDTLDSVRKHVLMLAAMVVGRPDLDFGQDQLDAFHANLLAVAGGIEAAVSGIEAATTPNASAVSRPAPALTEPRHTERAKAPKRRQRAA